MKKSSAEEEPKRSLEDVFREGFEGAESVPSAKLWENLNRELENKELRTFRKEVFWYRGVAAASLLFLLMTGMYFWKSGLEIPTSKTIATVPGKSVEPSDKATEKVKDGSTPPIFPETEKLAVNSEKSKKTKSDRPIKYVGKSAKGPEEVTDGQSSATAFPAKPGSVSTLGNALSLSKAEETILPPSNSQAEPSSTGLVGSEIAGKKEIESLLISPTDLSMIDSANFTKPASLLVLKGQKAKESAPVSLAEIDFPVATASKWGLSVAYAPQYAYSPIKLSESADRALLSNDVSGQSQMHQQYQEAVNEYKNSYSPAYSFSTTVKASYSINAKWQIESGLLYAKNAATTQHSYVIKNNRPGVATAAGFSIIQTQSGFNHFSTASATAGALSVARTQPYTTRYIYQQVGVPVRIGYRHSQNKIFSYASMGLNLNMLLKNTIETNKSSIESQQYQFKDPNSPFESWQLFSTASAGVGYDVSKNLSILVSPEVTYALTPFLKGDQYQTDSFQFGISVGTKLRLYK